MRSNAVAQAEVIIENQVTDFMRWVGNRELVRWMRRAETGPFWPFESRYW